MRERCRPTTRGRGGGGRGAAGPAGGCDRRPPRSARFRRPVPASRPAGLLSSRRPPPNRLSAALALRTVRDMTTILDTIVASKRREIAAARERQSDADLERQL